VAQLQAAHGKQLCRWRGKQRMVSIAFSWIQRADDDDRSWRTMTAYDMTASRAVSNCTLSSARQAREQVGPLEETTVSLCFGAQVDVFLI
jgi:hypothetical protein